MSTKPEIIAKLTELGIAHDPSATKPALEALLPAGTLASAPSDEIIIKDPLVLRPVDLPLVITLPATASKAQLAHAKVLNAYAYKNPTKWAAKKDVQIKKLIELKGAPDPVEQEGGIKFSNKLLGN